MKQMYRWYVLLLCLFLSGYGIASTHCNRVIATIGVGNSPNGIAITPDNCFAYVANNNNDSLPNGNTVSVLDLRTNTLKATITDASFNEPYTVTINKAGTKAYITNSGGSTISIIDIATNQVTGTITGFDLPSGMVIHPNGTAAYVNNYGTGLVSGTGTTVSIVNLDTNTIVGSVTVGLAPAGVAITPDGAFVYVINYVDGNLGTGTINVIRTSDNTVVKTITGFSGPFAIAITPDGHFAYVTNFGSNNFSPVGRTVSVVNLKTNTVCARIPLGTQPSGIAITSDGCFAYVTIYNTLYLGPNFTQLTPGESAVKIIDIATNKLLCPVLTAGQSPAQIALANGRAYVTNYSSDNVSVIDICDSMWLKSR